MKKNGFTFIEILGVITLLALISVVVLIVVDKSLKDARDTLSSAQLENIRSAASMWRTDNIEYIPDDGYYTIFLSTLQDNGYIDTDIIDISNNDSYNRNLIIKISMNDILVDSGVDLSDDDYMTSLANSEANIITSKVSELVVLEDGVYYFNKDGNLENGASIIHLNNNGDVKGNILIHNHQFISGCMVYGDYNYDYYKGTITKQDYPCSTVRGENLVINGDLSFQNNTNFSDGTYNSDGYISYTSSSNKTISTKNYVPINVNTVYEFDTTIKSSNQSATNYVGFFSYDIDRKLIEDIYVYYIGNTLTTLAQDLKDGDEYIYLTDMSNWNKTTTHDYQHGFIFWNYTDSTGYQYPELTYSRNSWNKLYTNDNIDLANSRIKLTSPWNHGTIVAGTKLSQCSRGSTYNYNLVGGASIPNTFTSYTSRISEFAMGTLDNKKYRYGTRYVKWFMWANYNGKPSVTTDIKDIYIKEVID